ncbi:uroporphyrinogen-III synthase [Magnetococcus marinus MC-1]|uniref:Uroporphyrinogen-III synthase n=1 Tax=Magnetococcus marinus (strain ATCC BAA-1437 / JCM 17883 / MC-1) TaxID=156889 RepID=A0L5L4_MAGMM|nr:uroporphyrinogen-III synthase [Magnetococcus marinus]ABK43257.1 uroporphyrinogen-III synthase [Magnetococcus marinus MC-1]
MATPALHQRTILVTRPQPEADATALLILQAGGTPIITPMLNIAPAEDSQPLQQAIAAIHSFDGVLITSANAARAYLDALAAQAQPLSGTPPCFAVGPKTAELLRAGGATVCQPSSRFDGEALAEAINQWQGKGRHFLFPRAAIGRETLIDGLENDDHRVTMVAAYRALPAQQLSAQAHRYLREKRVDAALFFSSRTATTFFELLISQALEPAEMVLAALSPVTAERMASLGFAAHVIAPQATAESLLQALADHWNRPTL